MRKIRTGNFWSGGLRFAWGLGLFGLGVGGRTVGEPKGSLLSGLRGEGFRSGRTQKLHALTRSTFLNPEKKTLFTVLVLHIFFVHFLSFLGLWGCRLQAPPKVCCSTLLDAACVRHPGFRNDAPSPRNGPTAFTIFHHYFAVHGISKASATYALCPNTCLNMPGGLFNCYSYKARYE